MELSGFHRHLFCHFLRRRGIALWSLPTHYLEDFSAIWWSSKVAISDNWHILNILQGNQKHNFHSAGTKWSFLQCLAPVFGFKLYSDLLIESPRFVWDNYFWSKGWDYSEILKHNAGFKMFYMIFWRLGFFIVGVWRWIWYWNNLTL